MQVTVEAKQGLERVVKIQLPADEVENKINSEVKEYSRKANIKGFRAGHVPDKIIRQRFGNEIRGYVVNQVMEENIQKALVEQSIKAAAITHMHATTNEPGEDLQFEVELEVFPEFELKDLNGKAIEQFVAEISDADLDEEIQRFLKIRVDWIDVERATKQGDQVTIDFVGMMDGEKFEGGSANEVPLELGSNRMIPGFEEGLIGKNINDEITLKLNFPDKYFKNDLAGKPVEFNVTIKKITEAQLPELTDELVKSLGADIENVEDFKTKIKEQMQSRMDEKIKLKTQDSVFDRWLRENDFDLPQTSVNDTMKTMQDDMQSRFGIADTSEKMMEDIEKEARRRVKLGILCQKYAEENKLKPDESLVRKLMIDELSQVQDQKQREQLVGNRNFVAHVQNAVLQEQIMELLLNQANTDEKKLTYTQIMNEDEEA